jgi:hypothetical protein
MARAALACAARLQGGDAEPFHTRKLATAVFYAAHLLPRAQALSAAILEGGVAARYARAAEDAE